MSHPTEVDEIRHSMQQVRLHINQDVEGVVQNAREMTDWRHHVKSHPWLSVAVAAAVGYALVPARKQVVKPDVDAMLELIKKKKIVVQPESVPKPSFVSQAMSLATGVLLRSAGVYAGQQLTKFFEQTQAGGISDDPSPAKPR